MLERTGRHIVCDLLDGRLYLGGGLLFPRKHRALCDWAAPDVGQHFTGTLHWQQLVVMQIHAQRSHSRPILRWSVHAGRKGSPRELLTGWATHLLHLMLQHHQMLEWQVMDLPALYKFTLNS